MSSFPHMKKGLVIGDPYLSLIGVAAGFDYFIYADNCRELMEYLKEHVSDYGLVIVLRSIVRDCSDVELFEREHPETLFIHLDSPKEIEKIDPKRYYEEMIARYIGLKFELK